MSSLQDKVKYLSEHYVYEINMLRGTYHASGACSDQFITNAMIESFCLHARSLFDFYSSTPRGDDVVATHFIASNAFAATATQALASALRVKINKQIAHLTESREIASKIDTSDRAAMMAAIEADHADFMASVDAKYSGCFSGEAKPTLSLIVGGPATATNVIQPSGFTTQP